MPTIIDVAKRAGVSFKTVSRVFSGEDYVREETKMAVLKAARELDYKVNVSARTLRAKRSNKVVLIGSNPSPNYRNLFQLGALSACQDAGFDLVLKSEFDESEIQKLVLSDKPVGIVLLPPASGEISILNSLEALGVPVIRVGAYPETGSGGYCIYIDDDAASFDITQVLIQAGHSAIAFLSGPLSQLHAQKRKDGHLRALQSAGISPKEDWVLEGNFDFKSGFALADKLLSSKERPSVIIASNDEMAAGCLAAAYKNNLRVPEDLSIAGFDDSPIAQVIYPPLTTIHQPVKEMAIEAIKLLDVVNRKKETGNAAIKLDYEVKLRGSTKFIETTT